MLFEPSAAAPFPVRLEADYPERLSRLSTFFRLFLAVPVLIVLSLLGQGPILVYWIGALVRGRPVRWLFDVSVAVERFTLRAYAYFLLLTDRYPPFDGDWPVRYDVDRPERLSRWRLVIWKAATVLPHFIVLGFVFIAVAVVVFLAWFAVLFTGRYPRGMHAFVAGSLRWAARARAYLFSLTDEFPSFSLAADVGPAYYSSYVISAIFGWLILVAWAGGIGALIAWPGQTTEASVSYRGLLQGEPSAAAEVSDVEVALLAAEDPYQFIDGFYQPDFGHRFLLLSMVMVSVRELDFTVQELDFRLKDSLGNGHDPVLVTVEGREPPVRIGEGDVVEVWLLFEVDEDARPTEFRYEPGFGFKQRVKFVLD